MTLLNIKPKNMMTTLCANLQNNLAVELCESRGMFIVQSFIRCLENEITGHMFTANDFLTKSSDQKD